MDNPIYARSILFNTLGAWIIASIATLVTILAITVIVSVEIFSFLKFLFKRKKCLKNKKHQK